jgi:hypothetical protein
MMGMPVIGAMQHRYILVPPPFRERNFLIAGVTKDSGGAALGNCQLFLFNWTTKGLEQTTTSDGAGNYSFVVDKTQVFRVVADNPSGPVFGVSANNLVGA